MVVAIEFFVFFFKQKTAYEMRISDWSSDVCSSDLPALDRLQELLWSEAFAVVALSIDEARIEVPVSFVRRLGLKNLSVYHDFTGRLQEAFPLYGLPEIGRASCRERVCQYV